MLSITYASFGGALHVMKDTAGPRAGKGEKWEKPDCVAPIGVATIPAHAGC